MSFAILTGEFNVSIPRIRVTDAGVEEYLFTDFDFDSKEKAQHPILRGDFPLGQGKRL